jgi:hypothetical protein
MYYAYVNLINYFKFDFGMRGIKDIHISASCCYHFFIPIALIFASEISICLFTYLALGQGYIYTLFTLLSNALITFVTNRAEYV